MRRVPVQKPQVLDAEIATLKGPRRLETNQCFFWIHGISTCWVVACEEKISRRARIYPENVAVIHCAVDDVGSSTVC